MMIIEVEDIDFTYPGTDRTVLKKCSLELHEGEIMSILGPNGAGKSTLMNCMCGLLSPQSGNIRIAGQDIKTMSIRDIAKQIGYVQQTHTPAFAYSVTDFVLMGRAANIGLLAHPKAEDYEAVHRVLQSLGIDHLADKPYTEISGGERQQATIARAIVQDPKVILFDEPAAHLDYGKQLVILRMIKEMSRRGYAAVMTTHNPDHTMLLGGTVAILDRSGTLECGPAEEVITEERLASVYETEIKMVRIPGIERMVCVPPDL